VLGERRGYISDLSDTYSGCAINFHPTVVSSESCSSPVVGQSDFAHVGRLMTLLPSIIGRHWCRGAPHSSYESRPSTPKKFKSHAHK
jgi:hypothetical protein